MSVPPFSLAAATGLPRGLTEVGRGATSRVFEVGLEGGARAALKVGLPGTAETLAREAEALFVTQGSGTPALLDVGFWDGASLRAERTEGAAPALLLEWIEGSAPEGPMPPGEVARLGAELAAALAALHAAGLAHGDVKPANVRASESGARLLDLGLSCPTGRLEPTGGTPRYLARQDSDLGTGRARDVLALGVVLAELSSDVARDAAEPLAIARALEGPLGPVVRALTAEAPRARPSAAWASRALGALEGRASPQRAWLRAAYLRVRSADVARAEDVGEDAPALLAEALRLSRRTDALRGRTGGRRGLVVAMDDARARGLLVALVGSAGASWPVGALLARPESEVLTALGELATTADPAAWTIGLVERALGARVAEHRQETGAARSASATPLSPPAEDAVTLALEIARGDRAALARVELDGGALTTLRLAAVGGLRQSGELGRALALAEAIVQATPGRADALVTLAETLRRAGARERALEVAALCASSEVAAEAAAVRARALLDLGRVDEAEVAAREAGAMGLEAAALVAARRGEREVALALARQGEGRDERPERQARLAGLRGYLLHGVDPEGSRLAFERAAELAAQAGAALEEATYRTGEAAALADLGFSLRAEAAARRASLLWEALDRPMERGRAELARAVALEDAGAEAEAIEAAHGAIRLTRDASDPEAEAYAELVLADLAPPGAAEGERAACAAHELLRPWPELVLLAEARLLRHGLHEAPEQADDRAATSAPPLAAFDWWAARAEALDRAGTTGPAAERVVTGLLARLGSPVRLASAGRAVHAGALLARKAGRGEAGSRLADEARRLARLAVERGGGGSDELASVRWVREARAGGADERSPAQSHDLELLCAALSDHETLQTLLVRIVDALVLWTGVERGLLLLRAPDGRLVPRAARNLARSDLGRDQLAVSQSLARRALDSGRVASAVDAAEELPDLHQSVHALRLRSVLAVPLLARGEALGVAYLDDRMRRGAFGEREIGWARAIAALAAVAIADARDRLLLRRAARKARRASEALGVELARREAELGQAREELARTRVERPTRFRYDEIVGETPEIVSLLRVVDRVSQSDVPVLISGESGSGKELFARAIHRASPRSRHAFVSENCGAIPEPLLESALFGHVRGAFTGADRQRAGLFEVAHKGTLFLDEIGEMTPTMQTKLLRVLEDGMVRPLGSEVARKVDVRVIGATNRDLEQMVQQKRFREDLYYRLHVVPVRVPPLRERAADVPLLAKAILLRHGGERASLTPRAMEALVSYAWPGNVRQLENELRRALVFADGRIDLPQLSPEVRGAAPEETEAGASSLDLPRRLHALEVHLVKKALDETGGNQTRAAKLLNVSRFGLQKMIKRLGVRIPD